MIKKEVLIDRMEELAALVEIQCSSGNWDHSPYMHGMTNGMILAQAMMEGKAPKYLIAPSKWRINNKEEAQVAGGDQS